MTKTTQQDINQFRKISSNQTRSSKKLKKLIIWSAMLNISHKSDCKINALTNALQN